MLSRLSQVSCRERQRIPTAAKRVPFQGLTTLSLWLFSPCVSVLWPFCRPDSVRSRLSHAAATRQ